MAAAVGILLGAYLSFAIGFYWMMQPSVAANHGVAAYRPPPKTVVRDTNSPWVPPAPEARPQEAAAEPAAELATREPIAEPKKQTRKREGRTIARQPARQQQNPFSGYASSRSGGSRPWF